MSYLMAGRLSELERLQLQSKFRAPAGEALLAKLALEPLIQAWGPIP
jgi:hypothetical protein